MPVPEILTIEMKTVILLSTYHPNEAYLSAQLASIEAQTLPCTLIRRDDSETHLGAQRSFEVMLTEAEGYDYYAFADQDDVWKPEKMSVLMQAMQEAEKEYGKQTPVVVHCDLEVVDEEMRPVAASFWQYAGLRPDIMDNNLHFLTVSNTVTGCAMLFNAAARKVSLPFGPQAYMHDQWIAQSALRAGGKVIPVAERLVYYRQHSSNTLGAIEHHFGLRDLNLKRRLFRQSYKAGKGICWRTMAGFIYWKTKHLKARL